MVHLGRKRRIKNQPDVQRRAVCLRTNRDQILDALERTGTNP
jgi:hypothetical protein